MPKRSDTPLPSNLHVLAAILLGGLLLYGSGFTIPLYGDDYLAFFPPLSLKVFSPFLVGNPQAGTYAPISDSYLVLIQSLSGFETWPVHVSQWLLHSFLCLLVYLGALKLGFSRLQGLLGAMFMLISQANVHAILSNDTISQILACLFGYLSVYYLLIANERRLEEDRSGTRSAYFISIFIYALALFSKETGAAFFFVIGALLLVASKGKYELQIAGRLRWALVRLIPYLALLIVYVALRSQIATRQPLIGDTRYAFSLGSSVLKNLALFGFASTTPVSSVDVFVSFSRVGVGIEFVAAAAATILFASLVGYGLWRSELQVHPLLLVFMGVLSLTPAYLLNKVSELYVYNAMPIVSLMVGAGLGGLLVKARESKLRVAATVTFLVVVLVSHVWSTQRKAAQMKVNGSKATVILEDVVRFAHEVPDSGSLVFLDRRAKDAIRYSVFLSNGMELVWAAGRVVKYLSGRDDFEVRYVLVSEDEPYTGGPTTVVLSMCEDDVHVCRVEQ